MHIVLIVIIVVVLIPLFWFLGPGHGHSTLQGRVNEWAWKRNADGKGNAMTRPILGNDAEPPQYLKEHDERFKSS